MFARFAAVQSGPYADANPFRWSTKYFDAETGLSDFGGRFYNASLGRWINRDPAGECGGKNLFTFVGNDPVDRVDYLGQMAVPCPRGMCGCAKDKDPPATQPQSQPATQPPVPPIAPKPPTAMEDCNQKLTKALQDPTIKKMIRDAQTWADGLGTPCLGAVRCTNTCGKGTLGWADPISRDALICAKNQAGGSQEQFNDTVREEVAHSLLMCGNATRWLLSCEGCMIEEKRAKYLAGLCKDDKKCTDDAWDSCAGNIGCWNKTPKDFLGVGWPPETKGLKPY